jgi:hypothetical protein
MLDQDMYKIAQDWSERVYDHIFYYMTSKRSPLLEDEEKIYNYLNDCKWFNIFPISKDESEDPTRLILTTIRYIELIEKYSRQKIKSQYDQIIERKIEEIEKKYKKN